MQDDFDLYTTCFKCRNLFLLFFRCCKSISGSAPFQEKGVLQINGYFHSSRIPKTGYLFLTKKVLQSGMVPVFTQNDTIPIFMHGFFKDSKETVLKLF